MSADLSIQHNPLGGLFDLPVSRQQWERYRLTEEQVAFYHEHGYLPGATFSEPADVAGGVAAGDYDGDGWTDLYVVHGEAGPNLLFRNRGDGRFEEQGQAAGVRWVRLLLLGGVRRSALISLSNLTDERMRHAKSGEWWLSNPQRA